MKLSPSAKRLTYAAILPIILIVLIAVVSRAWHH